MGRLPGGDLPPGRKTDSQTLRRRDLRPSIPAGPAPIGTRRPARAGPPAPDEPEPVMSRIPITGPLHTDLLATTRADRIGILRVAVVIEAPNAILLLHQGDGDDF